MSPGPKMVNSARDPPRLKHERRSLEIKHGRNTHHVPACSGTHRVTEFPSLGSYPVKQQLEFFSAMFKTMADGEFTSLISLVFLFISRRKG